MGEDLGFGGEVAGFYHWYRRGYPPAVIDTLIGTFALTGYDIVFDVGCGTGQLTLPIARRVQAVAGVDPEPDMLARARQAAAEHGIRNATWLLGADTDIPALAALLGGRRAGAVTIGQALHWMNYREPIPALVPLLRPGGGIAVITNGTPMWLQDSPWSRALRSFLEQWLGRPGASSVGHVLGPIFQGLRMASIVGYGLGSSWSPLALTSIGGCLAVGGLMFWL